MPLAPPWSELAASPGLWLTEDERALAPDPDLGRVRTLLGSWTAPTPEQDEVRNRILEFVDAHPTDAHRRTCLAGHLTGSGLVTDAEGRRALLTHHKKLDRWLQLGGHCDGDANLPGVALREALEESGIDGLRVLPRPIDLDVHPIPARPGEPGHLHLDVRFLVLAPAGAVESASDESHELGWFNSAEARALGVDASVQRLFERCFA